MDWLTNRRNDAGQDSGLPSESFTHVVSNIMFHTVPDSEVALRGRCCCPSASWSPWILISPFSQIASGCSSPAAFSP